ncbi:hypothetical protein Acr_23g0000580 [Actinidia rufa]|uniref:Uncharacterized protein n=1 Tax=Actinidia rufa TaxID=165716 RepID=A0A7J0GLJ1_9ERIC|nr:hypothetical protein Acr_23g0000580 [Actinidia rufa]
MSGKLIPTPLGHKNLGLTEMDNTRRSRKGSENDNPQMTELRDMLKQLGMTIEDYEGSFTNLAEYAPHLVETDEMRAQRFEEGLRHEIRRAIIRPLVLPTYADVLDRAIINEQDEIERKKYFNNKRRQNLVFKGPRLRSRVKSSVTIAMRGAHKEKLFKNESKNKGTKRRASRGYVRPARNTWLRDNRPGKPGNKGGNVNNQRQGRAFALMPGDARNTEDVVAG